MLSLLLPFFLLPSVAEVDPSEKKFDSKIDHVVVYQQGAQVERTSEISLLAGGTTVVIPDLSTAIDPSKLRITGSGDFTVLSISHRYHTDTLKGRESETERQRLYKRRNEIVQQINIENGQRVLFDREEQLLLNNQGFTVKDSGVDLERLIKANGYFRERFLAIHQGRAAIDAKVAELNVSIGQLDEQILKLPALETKTSLEVIVRVEATKPTKGELVISYWMQNAGWSPSYNARVVTTAEPLRLEYQAMVRQQTGEDWKNVGLTISTGMPSQNRSKPELMPWMLDGPSFFPKGTNPSGAANAWLRSQPYNPNVRDVRGQLYDVHGNPLVGAQVWAGGSVVTTDVNGFYTLGVPAGVTSVNFAYAGHTQESLMVSSPVMNVALAPQTLALSEVAVVTSQREDMMDDALFSRSTKRLSSRGAEEQEFQYNSVTVAYSPTQTRFEVASRHTIPSDQQEHGVRIIEHRLPVDYLHSCAPKLDPQVYLTAHFTGWEELDLLDGRMHIYFEDDYVGESQLRLDFVQDTLAISLGPDMGIQVRRKRTVREDNGALLSGKREYLREYEFSVINRKQTPIHLLLEDQVPLATNEDIEIERQKTDGASVDDVTGKVLWDLKIAAGKTEKKTLRYSVKAPKELPLRIE